MSKDVIMPALGMAQETGTLLRWLKSPGDSVTKGEMLMEVETDKAMVEVEATATGVLADITAQPGDVIPVGQVIARIVTAGDSKREIEKGEDKETGRQGDRETQETSNVNTSSAAASTVRISPVAARIAAEHGVDVNQIKNVKGVIQKEDVLAYVAARPTPPVPLPKIKSGFSGERSATQVLASPKARRLANERGIELNTLQGTGPDGAILATDILRRDVPLERLPTAPERLPTTSKRLPTPEIAQSSAAADAHVAVSNVWRVMVERLSHAWTTIPHFYLTRDVNASRLMSWRDAKKSTIEKVTYTDLLVKLVSAALQKHPRVNASWDNSEIILHGNINIGLAVALEQGLTVPVIHNASDLSLAQITTRRKELVERANAGKLALNEISGGTFTISNLGMYGVDAFNAIVNPPQAAILGVSRIAERVVPVNHQPSVQPMMTLTLSCDHRVIDGARGAQFLDTLSQLIEEPLTLLD